MNQLHKNKILSITVESRIDDYPDVSWIGKYTNSADEWNIDRETGRFVHSEIVRDRLVETIEERILEKEDDNPNFANINIEKEEKRLDKIRESIDYSPLNRNEYRYFQPEAGGEKPGTPDYKKHAYQNYESMEGLNRGDWGFIGIIAKATVQTVSGGTQHITSAGLWGIGSDSEEHHTIVAKEEIDSLKAELSSLGFSKRQISYATNRWNNEINHI